MSLSAKQYAESTSLQVYFLELQAIQPYCNKLEVNFCVDGGELISNTRKS